MRFLAGILPVAAAVVVIGVVATSNAAVSSVPSVRGGKFEVTCKPTSIPAQAIDPIVAPGVTSAHQHTFFGARGVTSTSTAASLQVSTAGTTCVLAQDGAAYWVPTACDGPCVDAAGVPTKGTDPADPITNVVKPVKIFAYYFGTTLPTVEAQYPANIQMVGGNAAATAPDTQMIGFSCGNGGLHNSPTRSLPYDCTAAHGVRGTDGVVAIVKFPYCLEPSGGVEYGAAVGGACPTGDQTLGQVQIHVHYGLDTTGFQTGSALNFASGLAYTFHGDWMNGWQQPKLQALVAGCLDIDKDCGFLTASNPGP